MKRFAALILAALCLSACQPTTQLTVFAAASLTDAMDELTVTFASRHPDVRVVTNYAGSSQLAAQLMEGASADVFASANPQQMTRVEEAGYLTGQGPQPFTTNHLIVITSNPNLNTLQSLTTPGTLIVIGAPGVPIRTYTDQMVANITADQPTFGAAFYANVVSEEDNVRQVVAKVALGEADAGVVYISDVTSDVAATIAIPSEYNITATYPIAVLQNAPQPELAAEFVTFVRSTEGQAILQKWGFGD